jgi:hypothetical protein
MHLPINVKSPNNISKLQMGFNSAFKGLRHTSTRIQIRLLLSVHPICFTRLTWRTSADDTTSHEPNTFCNMHSYQQNYVSTNRHSRYVRINRLDSHRVARPQLDTHLQTTEKKQSEDYKWRGKNKNMHIWHCTWPCNRYTYEYTYFQLNDICWLTFVHSEYSTLWAKYTRLCYTGFMILLGSKGTSAFRF